jgi:hypothetical protein
VTLKDDLEREYFAFKRGLKHRRRSFASMTIREHAGSYLYIHGTKALEVAKHENMKLFQTATGEPSPLELLITWALDNYVPPTKPIPPAPTSSITVSARKPSSMSRPKEMIQLSLLQPQVKP